MDEVTKSRLEFAKAHKAFIPLNNIHWSVQIGTECTIGADGFGWIRQDDGTLYKMPHMGNVIIDKDVVIGNNVCIDRAVIGSTFIGEGTKIDNLVHVAHGVHIGKHCLLTAGCIIGGSVRIGRGCYIGIGALIKNKIKIGDNVTVGMGAVVIRDVSDGQTVVGNPAKQLIKECNHDWELNTGNLHNGCPGGKAGTAWCKKCGVTTMSLPDKFKNQ